LVRPSHWKVHQALDSKPARQSIAARASAGQRKACNFIVSTTNNNHAMNEAIRAVASRYLSGHELTEGLLNYIEVAIRAYDPCLSCATHALGQMPLEVELVDAGGALVSRARKG
jgi:NAD-reducing hydrogenase large subunit